MPLRIQTLMGRLEFDVKDKLVRKIVVHYPNNTVQPPARKLPAKYINLGPIDGSCKNNTSQVFISIVHVQTTKTLHRIV